MGFSTRRAVPSVEYQSLFLISSPYFSPSFLARSSKRSCFRTLVTPSTSSYLFFLGSAGFWEVLGAVAAAEVPAPAAAGAGVEDLAWL
jgi:hypothetical protein